MFDLNFPEHVTTRKECVEKCVFFGKSLDQLDVIQIEPQVFDGFCRANSIYSMDYVYLCDA